MRQMFHGDDPHEDDLGEGAACSVDENGVHISVECDTCDQAYNLTIPWSEIKALYNRHDVRGFVKTDIGYMLQVRCQKCERARASGPFSAEATERSLVKLPLGQETIMAWYARVGRRYAP